MHGSRGPAEARPIREPAEDHPIQPHLCDKFGDDFDFAVQTSPQRGLVSLSPAYPDDALGGRKVGPWAARTETNLAGGGTAFAPSGPIIA